MADAPKTTREELLDAAERLFAERGFYGASIAAIAEELGLTKQALLHHFATKERLYGEVLERISGRFSTMVEEATRTEAAPEAQLETLFLTFFNLAMRYPDETQLLMRELLDNKRRAGQAGTWYLKPFLEGLTALARRTRRWSGASDAEALAGIYQLLGAVNYFAISEPTLSQMFGRPAYGRVRDAYPDELGRLLRAALGPIEAR